MIKYIYSVYDNTTDDYSPPMLCLNDKDAMRMLQQELTNNQSKLTMFPQDFDLVCLGEFNTTTGKIKSQVGQVCPVDNLILNGLNHATKATIETLRQQYKTEGVPEDGDQNAN